MASTDDVALVARAQAGDTKAFEGLVARYERKVYNLAYRLTGNHEDASDMAQEAFVKVYLSLPDFRSDASFATWVYRITSNACLDELRKRQRQKRTYLDAPVELSDHEAVARQLPDHAEGPEESLLRRESHEALEQGIQALDEEYRTILVLRDIQGHSYEEIAEWLNIPLGTVKSRLSRARTTLKDLMMNMELLGAAFVYSSRRRKSGGL